jgi:hypothetical protein
MGAYIPPGWPAGVHPPGSEDFESTAIGWLLDVVPPDYRLHGVLRRYPVALATMARYHSKACVEGARQGYRTARTELAGTLPPHAIDTVLAAYRKEGERLAATARAVDLVERALRGEVFTPKMNLPPAAPGPQSAEPRSAETRSAGPEATRQRPARTKTEQKAAQRTAKPRAAEERPPGAKAAGVKAAGIEAAGQQPTGAEAAGQQPTGAEAARRRPTGVKAAEKAAEQKAVGAKAGTGERGRTGTVDQGQAAARRNSAGRGRSDLART